MDHAERMTRFAGTDLYAVITAALCNERPALDILDACLAAGVGVVQYREKDLSGKELFEQAQAFRERCRQADALLIIDDRLDVALAVEADGVHLGQEDLPLAAARQLAPELILGASSHNIEEALEAQAAGASYVNIGPIFATQTKSLSHGPLGPEAIEHIAPHLHVPITCMGGIKAHNIAEVTRRGIRHVAVVTAVTAAADPEAAARSLRHAMRWAE